MAAAVARAGTLRLASAGVVSARPMLRESNAADVDPRWVIAVQAARSLEGGRAAILTPEARARVVALARGLGLRPFDAALVIAIVQDAARRGEPLGGEVSARLGLVACTAPERAATWTSLLFASILLGGCISAALIAAVAL